MFRCVGCQAQHCPELTSDSKKNTQKITGAGDLTKLNIPAGDDGGELDPHGERRGGRLPTPGSNLQRAVGADGLGNPIGGLVFSTVGSSDGSPQQMHEWTNFMCMCGAFSSRKLS